MADPSPAAMPSLWQRSRLGARLGMLLGGLLVSLWSLLILGGIVEVAVQGSGLARAAHGYLAEGSGRLLGGSRPMYSDTYGDTEDDCWNNGRPCSHAYNNDAAAAAGFQALVQFITFIVVLVIEIFSIFVYYGCYIKPTYQNFIPKNAIIPQDLLGRWKYDIFDCGDCGTFCCFLWCTPCTLADLWYRAGWIHASTAKTKVNCDGWQYFAGVCTWCGIMCMSEGCMPCVLTALRNGCSCANGGDSDLGEIVPLKKMFRIPTTTCNDFTFDVCCYLWCAPCVSTQEYRQVMEVLKRGQPQVQASPVAGMVVGNAVMVGTPVQGTMVQGKQ